MVKDLFLIGIGVIAGAAGMYLIARNSPEHFLKTKKFVDKAYAWGQGTFSSLKNRVK